MASGGSSLKISFKDTLYLLDEVKRPIKFLHEDTTKNVAGAYVQVHRSFTGSTNVVIDASYYYDVPEIPEMADNDSVSVILVGVDPTGLLNPSGVPPAGAPFIFDVTIIPYDKNGQPLGSTTRPVKIADQNINPTAGVCGLVLPDGQYWHWDLTLIEDPNSDGLVFYNDPDKKWGPNGQFINGCCIDGKSSYNINCSGDTAHYRSLRFKTFFVYQDEVLQFFSSGEYHRNTVELHSLPAPDESDFCGSGTGVVHWKEYNVFYLGNWSVNQLTTRFQGDSLNLTLVTKDKVGGSGYGRSGGIIHQLDCNTLVLIQRDREGQSRHEVSFFIRRHTSEEDGWYAGMGS